MFVKLSLGIGWIGLKTLLDDWIIFFHECQAFNAMLSGLVGRLTVTFALYLAFMAT